MGSEDWRGQTFGCGQVASPELNVCPLQSLERVRVRPSRFSRSYPEELRFDAISLGTNHQPRSATSGQKQRSANIAPASAREATPYARAICSGSGVPKRSVTWLP